MACFWIRDWERYETDSSVVDLEKTFRYLRSLKVEVLEMQYRLIGANGRQRSVPNDVRERANHVKLEVDALGLLG